MNDERRTGMDDVLEAIGGISSDVRNLTTRLGNYDATIRETRDLLQGKDGMVATVAVHTEAIKTLKNNKKVDRVYSTGTGFLGGLLGFLSFKWFFGGG